MPARAPLSRRTAVAGAALAPLVLTSCDIDPPRGEGSAEPAAPSPSDDVVLVADLVSSIGRAAAVVAAAGEAVPALRAALTPLSRAHETHLGLLERAAPEAAADQVPEAVVPSRRRPALTAVRRAERALERDLVSGVGAAASGDLARVLAVMAASVAQHLAALDLASSP